MIAPIISPILIRAPFVDVFGIIITTATRSSIIPKVILPQDSTPKLEKIRTLSGCAVNLKNEACADSLRVC